MIVERCLLSALYIVDQSDSVDHIAQSISPSNLHPSSFFPPAYFLIMYVSFSISHIALHSEVNCSVSDY